MFSMLWRNISYCNKTNLFGVGIGVGILMFFNAKSSSSLRRWSILFKGLQDVLKSQEI